MTDPSTLTEAQIIDLDTSYIADSEDEAHRAIRREIASIYKIILKE